MAGPKILRGPHPLRGLKVITLSPRIAMQIGVNYMDRGVLVLRVPKRDVFSRKWRWQVHDIIQELNDTSILTVSDLERKLSNSGRLWRIKFKRRGKSYTVRFGNK